MQGPYREAGGLRQLPETLSIGFQRRGIHGRRRLPEMEDVDSRQASICLAIPKGTGAEAKRVQQLSWFDTHCQAYDGSRPVRRR